MPGIRSGRGYGRLPATLFAGAAPKATAYSLAAIGCLLWGTLLSILCPGSYPDRRLCACRRGLGNSRGLAGGSGRGLRGRDPRGAAGCRSPGTPSRCGVKELRG